MKGESAADAERLDYLGITALYGPGRFAVVYMISEPSSQHETVPIWLAPHAVHSGQPRSSLFSAVFGGDPGNGRRFRTRESK